MGFIPYGLLDRIKGGAKPLTENERRQWIGQLRVMDPIPYGLIRDVQGRPLGP